MNWKESAKVASTLWGEVGAPYWPDRKVESTSDLGAIRESMDVDPFEMHRSFIIAGRRLRETQIGSGSTEQEKEGDGREGLMSR